SYGGVQGDIAAGGLDPLDGVIDGLDAIPESYQDGIRGREDGRVYGVPFATQTLQVFYNEDVFAEHGLSEPKTWDEFLDNAEKLKSAGVIPLAHGGADAGVSVPITTDILGVNRYGGTEFYEAVLAGDKDFTDPDYVASLQVMKDLQPYFSDNVVATTYTDAQAQFIAGQAAMFTGGSWELGFFKAQNPDLKIGVFSPPLASDSVAATPLTPGFIDGGWGLASRSKHKDEAKKLLEWMTTPEFGQLFVDELAQMSTIPGVTFSDPIQKEMSEAFAEHGAPYMMLVGFRYGQPWGTALVGDGVQKLWLGQQSADQVAGDVQTGLETWFTPGE
ncbi:MAG: extracellular solute-binding protein, partial [Microbacterium sp.]